ncbi:Liprin-alpha-2 Protein tyrosine phosphatase receptor type f polypeptide-interacting protein alpha-2 [Triplophysa tibetana]|uniref:Liprin-alpha-2 Protein tyrosine phosphatase receptor type f polypeptide-interacting protein alpha-2 n=1 Tax=Triplophysa tibetana TaxID=1572043 RepID=A0A5A9PK38_9TELE|nr:Liprin-alpha-2 Protein tyrosine phosphatase receptor type f polypeptide-interacting protein alpha-2 [Triplophysa tibetana]
MICEFLSDGSPSALKQEKMMCEVMPTISEDTALSQRGSQSSASDPDSHFEQLMVNMLDERDRLLDTLRETQESLALSQQHIQDVIYDRDSLQRQLSSALPQPGFLQRQDLCPPTAGTAVRLVTPTATAGSPQQMLSG